MFERRLALEAIRFVNRDSFVLSFQCPEIAAAAAPGQFLMLSAGGRIDPLLRRPMAVYQVSGAGSEGTDATGFSVLVERTGRGTTLLAALNPGEVIDVLGPLGRPFDLPGSGGDVVLVMGGVGAAPFPMLAAQLRAAGHPVQAFIGGRSADRILCEDELRALGATVVIATEDGSAGHHGLVTEPLEQYLDTHAGPAMLYSCGPTPMMRAVERLAAARGVGHQVSLEAPMACGIGVCLSCVVPVREREAGWRYRRICREGPVFDARTLLWEHPDA